MINFGRYVVSNYLAPAQPLLVTTGVNWEYIRIINNSAYLLSLDFTGLGKIDFPEMYIEDIFMPSSYRGSFTVSPAANLSNIGFAPSNLVTINAYQPGELRQPQSQPLTFLSNVGNTVNVSTVQTLSNEGNPAGTLVEDWGPSTPGQVGSIWNDHFLWKVVQTGVAHQVLAGNTSGNPLQIGQAGDITEVLGQLLVDQVLTATGNIIANGGMNINTIRDDVSGTPQIALATAGTSFANIISALAGVQFTVGTLTRIKFGAVAATSAGVAVTHGLGAVPDVVFVTPDNATATVTATASGLNSTQLTVSSSVNSTVWWLALKF